jgi:hypothetical protein
MVSVNDAFHYSGGFWGSGILDEQARFYPGWVFSPLCAGGLAAARLRKGLFHFRTVIFRGAIGPGKRRFGWESAQDGGGRHSNLFAD